MSIGSLGGVPASVAGTSLAQAKGSESERASQDAVSQSRRAASAERAEMASGIGRADGEDHETAERDADGRRLWEEPPGSQAEANPSDPTAPPRPGKDPTGQVGTLLDLTG